MHDAFAIGNLEYNPVCPLDPNTKCIDVGGQMQLCGSNKVCIGCGNFDMLAQNPGYSIFQYVHYEGDKAYGMSWYEAPPTYVEQTVENAKGRIPTQEELQKFKEFFGNDNVWYQGDEDFSNPEVKKYIGIVWDNAEDAGFLGMCVTDDNGDGLCTADMIECYAEGGNWKCPYGDEYPCQPYQGKY